MVLYNFHNADKSYSYANFISKFFSLINMHGHLTFFMPKYNRSELAFRRYHC
jgi:hypothetical protein